MQLREDQRVCVEQALEHIRSGRRAVLLDAPTGSGKTVMLTATLSTLLAERPAGLRVLWVAHRDRLLLQAVDTLHRVSPSSLRSVTFLNTASHRHFAADILVVDEAHHDAAASYHRIRARVAAAIVLAATATPERVDHLGLAFDTVVSAPTIDDLIALGVLSPFEHYSLTGRPSADALVAAAIAAAPMWGPSLVFVATTDEAHTGVARLRAAGIQAAVALGDHRRESAITAFTAGQVQMLVSVHALTEGVDLPFVRTVFLRDSIRGPVVQAVGRALRRCGEKVANVVQFADAKHPYPLIATPRRRFVGPPNGPWCELTARPTWPDSIVSPATRTIL